MNPALEPLTQRLNYGDLPETWWVPEAGRFSVEKTLYDYQMDALQKATRALFLSMIIRYAVAKLRLLVLRFLPVVTGSFYPCPGYADILPTPNRSHRP